MTGRVIVVGLLATLAASDASAGSQPAPIYSEPPMSRVPIIVDADFELSAIAARLLDLEMQSLNEVLAVG